MMARKRQTEREKASMRHDEYTHSKASSCYDARVIQVKLAGDRRLDLKTKREREKTTNEYRISNYT